MNLPISNVSTTKMTSKGQVVIPEEIREFMQLESGVKFIVMATDDSIVFKKIMPIPEKELKSLLKASRQLAKEHNLAKSGIDDAIKDVRIARKRRTSKSKSKAKAAEKKK